MTDSGEIQDMIAIFSNIETLLEVHEKIHKVMLDIQDLSWPIIQGLGRLFMENAHAFQNYQAYAENSKVSQATLEKVLSQKKSKLRDVIEVCDILPLLEVFLTLDRATMQGSDSRDF